MKLIADTKPDVLAVQEVGDEIVFSHFQAARLDAGLDYLYAESLQRGELDVNLAVLNALTIGTSSAPPTCRCHAGFWMWRFRSAQPIVSG